MGHDPPIVYQSPDKIIIHFKPGWTVTYPEAINCQN